MRHGSFSRDFRPILEGCTCTTCATGTSRAFIHHLINKETVGAHLLTIHNVSYLLSLVNSARRAIIRDRFPAWVKLFFDRRFPERNPGGCEEKQDRYPKWAVDALRGVGVDLLENDTAGETGKLIFNAT